MAFEPVGTTYQQVLSAVGDYYGTGSDQWLSIAQHGIGANNAEAILKQVPGVNIIKNNAGQITAMTYDNPFTYTDGGVSGEINSNVQLPTQGNGNTFKGSIPASGTVNQSGNIDVSSGARKVSDNSVVPSTLTTVSTAVAGLSIGTRLGTNILQRMYDGNPDYWDSTFPSINPQTWDTIAGENELGKSIINAIFKIDKSTGQAEMYLPEDALNYYAYGMMEQGFFSSGGKSVTSYDGSMGELSDSVAIPLPFGDAIATTNIGEATGYYWITEQTGAEYEIVIDDRYGYTINTPYYVGKSPINGRYKRSDQSDSRWVSFGSTAYNFDGVNYYVAYGTNNANYNDVKSGFAHATQLKSVIDKQDLIKLIYGGTVSSGAKEGTEKQDSATYPDTTGWTDPQTAGQSLRQQRPDLYDNAIYTDVPQPDGTTKRIVYVPVSTTGTTGAEDATPTNTTVTYNQTIVNDNSNEDLLKTIIRYITQTQTETPSDTPNPPDTPNPTDTGDGNTPPVVPPTGQASSLFAVYNPTQAQLNNFGAWLWSANFVDQILKLFNDPMQSIIGLHKIFAAPSISGSSTIHVGYLDSGVGSNTVGAQYTDVNCGSVQVYEQFGNAFDYTDTHVRLYLPFIGIVDLDTSDVMRGTISVIYHVDVITGACLAEVKVSRDSAGGTLYQYAGDAAVRYPISSGSYMGVVSGVLSAVGGIASAFMTGGATLPMAAGAIAGGVSQAKTQVQHSGNFSGCAGAMGAKKPYLIIERPQTMIADGFANYQGRGANVRRTVGQMSGYFKFSDVHTDSISGAAESEIEAIRAALESGVIA